MMVGQQEGHPACKNVEWWGAGVVICLGQSAELHMAQMMLLPLTVSCSVNRDWFYQKGSAFLVPAYPGCPGKKAIKQM